MRLPDNVKNMIIGTLSIAEGVALILSLGFYYPRWILTFLIWNDRREIYLLLREEEEGLRKRGLL